MNIALIGYGKMGQEIEKMALERNHTISLIIDKENLQELHHLSSYDIDVAIEFTTPETAFNNYIQCFSDNIPVVSGTTGWLDKYDEIIDICKKNQNTFFYASNFSLGVNIFFELNKKLGKMMNQFPEYKAELEEIHHVHKLDAPSGTAVSLANDLISELDRINHWKLIPGECNDNDLPVKAIRKGEINGTHKIIYNSEIDTIQISHEAKSRKGFVLGALLAAEFIQNKTGIFGMNDLIQL